MLATHASKGLRYAPTRQRTIPFSYLLRLPPAIRERWYEHGRSYSSDEKPSHDIAVLGGGITGLASAYYITQQLPSAKVTIYEAGDRIGGWLSSKRVPVKDGTVLFEAGPRTLRTAGNGVLSARLIQELDMIDQTIFTPNSSPAARSRYLYYPDHLVRLPHPASGILANFRSVVSEAAFSGSIWSAIAEFFKDARPPTVTDESIGDFFSRRFSKAIVDRLISGMVHGIYAGDVYQLSAKSLFPAPWRMEANAGSIWGGFAEMKVDGPEVPERDAEFGKEMQKFEWNKRLKILLSTTSVFTFSEGLGMLIDRLARRLRESGNVDFKTNTPVSSVSLTSDKTQVLVTPKAAATEESKVYSHAISALSPQHLSGLLPFPLQALLDIPAVTVMTVNLYFRTPDLHPPGFGYLIPLATPFEQNPERALGVIFDCAYDAPEAGVDAPFKIKTFGMIPSGESGEKIRQEIQRIQTESMDKLKTGQETARQDHVESRGTKVTVMLGGHFWDYWPAFPSKEEGLDMAKSILARHLNITEEPEAHEVNVQKDCIPQYTVGHEDRLKAAHNRLWQDYKGRLKVAGNWMSGVGVNDCLRSAWDVVRNIKNGKDGTGLDHVGRDSWVRLKPAMVNEKVLKGEE